jgi:Na+/H+-translocating membrane pyrophosphatase
MAEKRTTGKGDKGDKSVTRIATIAAGAAIGSAAIAAAVLFATKKRDDEAADGPAKSGRMPPETD